MQRIGMVTGLRAEKVEAYKELHAAVWPKVLDRISEVNIENYSIFLHRMPDGQHLLFSYFEYTGQDFDADMAKMADDPVTQEWWKLTDPCQDPAAVGTESGIWAMMPEVFHHP